MTGLASVPHFRSLRRLALVFASTAAVPAAATPLRAAEPPAGSKTETTTATQASELGASRRRLAFAISGGASLGAYEGGFLHTLIEDLRELSKVVEPHSFSGTSAGAINAFIAILQACSAPPEGPEASAFYRTWMPISFEALFQRTEVGAVSALSRSALEAPIADLRQDFEDGLSEACDMLLGVTATRVKPHVVTRAEGRLRLPRMAAQFLLRIQGRGEGRAPVVTNHVGLQDRSLPQLPLAGPGASAFDALVDLTLASSAFPFAFAPVEVAHCPGRAGQLPCRPDTARTDLFLDGGIFDQNPVNVGIEELTDAQGQPDLDARLYLLDPFQREFPKLTDTAENSEIEDALAYAARVAAGFVETARAQGLEMLLRVDPALSERLVVSASKYPPYGELAFYFLSFFEEGFRKFDFALGMFESKRAFRQAQNRAILLGDHEAARAMKRASLNDKGLQWAPYRCVNAILGPPTAAPRDIDSVCAGEAERLRPLAMVSRERVYDACRPERLSRGDPSTLQLVARHPDCQRAYDGESPPGASPDWPRRPDESELQWVFRRLEAHGYRFVELGPTRRADRAFEALRRQVLRCANAFASQQDGIPGFPTALARAVVNQMAYRPPRQIVHIALGLAQEVGFSHAIGPTPGDWLRWTAAVELNGLATVLSARENYLGVAATLGLEAEVQPLSGPALQVRTGLRGGWLFASPDGGGFGTCDDPGSTSRSCSRPIVEGILSLHVIDYFRIALTGQYSAPSRTGEKALFELRPSLGAQIILD